MRRIPSVTIAVVGFSVLVFLLPGFQRLFVYDRSGILSGEFWRLITCHWVHFSAAHFIYDTAAFGIAGWMIERSGYRNFGWLCSLAAITTSVVTFLCAPHLQICGGLSGLAMAAVVFLALHGLEEGGAWCWICAATLALSAAKMATELITGRFVFLRATPMLIPVPTNHVAGALTAVAVYAWSQIRWSRAPFGQSAEKNMGIRP